MKKEEYYRTKEQSEDLALNPDEDIHCEQDEIDQKSALDSTQLVPTHKDAEEVTSFFLLFYLHYAFRRTS